MELIPGSQLFQHLYNIYEAVGGLMREKRKIDGKPILDDVRSGMTDGELQVKYSLSANGLSTIFEKLVARQAISHTELCGRSSFTGLGFVTNGSAAALE